ncbi:acyltransferase family protein [Microbacterium sp. A82]|uniref:acyltransferase family protein n=1 Tax=unclassified Microbacterium TaxID=2609290 RepID=UPI003F3F3B9C
MSARPSNLFDALRLAAASMVIVGHAWPLSGLSGVPTFAGIRIHHLGVYIFFAISGYLLATSWERDPRAIQFLIRRCLRIFPALIVVVVLTVFLIGPVASTLPAADYWASSDTWRYLLTMLLFAQYELPGVFTTNPEPVVNGSLWSLGVEFCCYLVLLVTALLGHRAGRAIRGALILTIGSAVLTGWLFGPMRTTAMALVFFLLGSLASRGGKLAHWPIWPALIGLVAIGPTQGSAATLLAWPVVTYAVVAIGSRPSRSAGVVRRPGDPSYGMYLWGFPVQQLLIVLFGPVPLLVNIALSLSVSMALGYASWLLIEKRAIALGSRVTSSRKRSLPMPPRR